MTILRGGFFGEMALFSGEPSPLSIVAVDDLQVIVIYSDAVNTMIERQPTLGREIGQIIEARSKAVRMARQADVSSHAEVDSLSCSAFKLYVKKSSNSCGVGVSPALNLQFKWATAYEDFELN